MTGRVPNRPVVGSDVAATFLRWTYMRAVFHRGYVLVSSLYFVIDAHLSASQLLVLGSVIAGTDNSATGTLETRVLVSARRLRDLKAAPEDGEIETLEQIDLTPRALQAVELLRRPSHEVAQ